MDDNVYEGNTNEKFIVFAVLESGNFEGRISILSPSVEFTIEDNDPRPGIHL